MLTDVCPYTLGVDIGERLPGGAVRNGIFAPIIERNTVIPASREKLFSTIDDGQTQVEFKIYQGESRDVSRQHPAGQGIDPGAARPRQRSRLTCRFTYDINGLLEVDVHVPKTGERRQLVIVDDEARMDEAEARDAAARRSPR